MKPRNILDYHFPSRRGLTNFDYMDWLDWTGIGIILAGVIVLWWAS